MISSRSTRTNSPRRSPALDEHHGQASRAAPQARNGGGTRYRRRLTWSFHVRVAHRSLRRDLHAPARTGQALRGRPRPGAARDPHRALGRRRQPRRRARTRREDPLPRGRRRARQEPHAGAAGHQDRQRGADRDARWRAAPHQLRLEAADGRPARRVAGFGQDERCRRSSRRWFLGQGRHPLLVAADLQRPAAVEQLRILGREVGAAVFSAPTDPVDVAAARGRRGDPRRSRCRHHRHGRTRLDRRSPDGRGGRRGAGRLASLHVPRRSTR